MIAYKEIWGQSQEFGDSFNKFGSNSKILGAKVIWGVKLIKSGGLNNLGADSLILRVQLIMFL